MWNGTAATLKPNATMMRKMPAIARCGLALPVSELFIAASDVVPAAP